MWERAQFINGMRPLHAFPGGQPFFFLMMTATATTTTTMTATMTIFPSMTIPPYMFLGCNLPNPAG